MRCYVEPSPSGGYFVRLRGEPAPLSRHDTEEEAEAAAAAYERGLARADTADHVVLADGSEVEIRPAAGVDHLDVEAIEALVRRQARGRRALRALAERLHVAALTVDVDAQWRAVEGRLLRRLAERAAENGVRVFARDREEIDVEVLRKP